MTEDVMGVPVAYQGRASADREWKNLDAEEYRLYRADSLTVGDTWEYRELYTAAQAQALADAEVAKEREACALLADEWDHYATIAIRARAQGGGNERS